MAVLEDVVEEIHGNGRPGLKSTVERHADRFDQMGKFFWIVIGGIVSVLGTVVVAAAQILNKLTDVKGHP